MQASTDSNAAFQTVQTNAGAISSISGNYNTMSGNTTGSTNSRDLPLQRLPHMQSWQRLGSQAFANAVTNKNAETAATNAANGVSLRYSDGAA